MNRNVFILSVSLFAWIALSCFWYTCRIKGNCFSSKTTVQTQLFADNLSTQTSPPSDTFNPSSEDELVENSMDFEISVGSLSKDNQKNETLIVEKPIKIVSKLPCPIIILSETMPVINDIQFNVASSQISCDKTMRQYAQAAKVYLEENKGIIEIIGHTDNGPKPVNNFTLGLERALSVKLFLIKEGIPAERIVTNSKGDKDPVADNSTALGRQQNSRVTIKIK